MDASLLTSPLTTVFGVVLSVAIPWMFLEHHPTTPTQPSRKAHAQPFAAYRDACHRVCSPPPRSCTPPRSGVDLVKHAACVEQCVQERKLDLALAVPFGPMAARCQHRTNLAVLCVLEHETPAPLHLTAHGELNVCADAFRFALSACQGQVKPGTLL